MGCLALRYCLRHCWIQQGILHFDSTLHTLTQLLFNTCFCKFYSLTLSFSNPGVLIYVGCDNRIPWTGWLIKNRNYFLVLECGKSKIKTGRLKCLVRACLLVHRWLSSCCVLTWWKGQRSSLGSLLQEP